MHLKSLELTGFKSFGRKTVFDFQPGITAIIGPNGSGKSNICDSIRWVLGEQSARALRGTKMSEIIFAGSSHLRSSSFAQVKLILDNEDKVMPVDYTEVSIGRQLYKSGESNYYINNTRALMSNIKEMLMDTGIGKDGYSVIGQGDIDDIIFQRSQSRRSLIEEAAGITKFRHRKNNTLNKLSHTRANITRLTDIINEIENQLGPLEEQAEKTRKYKILATDIKQLEIDLVLYELNKLHSEHENIDSMRKGLLGKIAEVELFLAEIDTKKAEARSRFAEFETTLTDGQKGIKNKTEAIELVKTESSKIRETISSSDARKQAIEEEIETIEVSLLEGSSEINEAKNRLNEEETQELDIASKVTEIESKAAIVKEELDAHLKDLAQDKDSVFQLAVQMTERKNKVTTANQQIQILERQLERGENDVSSVGEQLNKLRSESKRLKSEIETMQVEIEENKIALSEETTKLNKVEKDYNRGQDELVGTADQAKIVRARMNLLEEFKYSRESGIFRGVQAVLALKETGRLQNVYGIVGDLISVKKGFETAFETALGGNIQDIVTQDAETAKKAINHLKQNRVGRATFLPLDMINPVTKTNSPNVKGCLGVALDLIEYDAKFYNIMSYLLGRVLIFEHIDDAVEFARTNRNFGRIVTLEGDIVRSSGALTGGGDAKKSGGILARKREQAELEQKVTMLDRKEKQLRSVIGNYQKERSQLLASTNSRQNSISRREQSLEFFENTFKKNIAELTQRDEEFTNIEKDRSEMVSRLKELGIEAETASKELQQLEEENKELSGRLNSMSGKEESIQLRLTSLNEMIGDKRLKLAQISERKKAIQKEIEAASKRSHDSEARKKRALSEVSRLTEMISDGQNTVATHQENLRELEAERKQLEDNIGELQESYRQISKELDQLDHAYQSRVRIEDSTKKKLSELDIKLAEVKINIRNKEGVLKGDFDLEFENTDVNLHKYESKEDLKNRILQKKYERDALEPVNPMAIEDYEKSLERFNFLNSQVDDMTEAADSLEEVISEIEKISAERFTETFAQINLAFADIFEILFPGGTGLLKLTDKNDPLNSNVEIVCKLPGKKLSTLELFSGGEKALISLALLFSILQVKPPAFCLLDEVEAALDEVNVKRFTRMLRSFAGKTQFLVITHNKETMQAVDVIYGITLEKSGISKPISIRLEDEDQINEFTVSKKGHISKRKLPIKEEKVVEESIA